MATESMFSTNWLAFTAKRARQFFERREVGANDSLGAEAHRCACKMDWALKW